VFRTPSQEAEYQSKARSDQVAPAYASQFFRGSRDRYGSSGFGSSDDGTYDPAIQTMLARRRQQYGQPFGQQLVPQAFGQPNEEVQALKAKVETVSRAVEQLASQERDTAAVAETALVAASSRGRAAGGKRRT
jgi:hypothetical protein